MPHHFTPSDIQRFWAKVRKTSNPGDCWPWTAALFTQGYGVFRHQGKNLRSSRVAYELTYGPIPEGLVVRHSCDVRGCCNPAHLLLGTNADNSADMKDRGRSLKGIDTVPAGHRATGERNGAHTHPERLSRGERHHASKLTIELVREIRLRYKHGETQTAIAADLGLNQTSVSRVVLRQTWVHVE